MIRYERADGGGLVAVAEVRLGVDRVTLEVPLGPWDAPDPDPGGLRGIPVVVLPGADGADLVAAGARRSGGVRAATAPGGPEPGAPPLGAWLLRTDPEVAVVRSGRGDALAAIRALGGRPLPALPLDDPGGAASMLEGCPVDLDVVVPSPDDDVRASARAAALALGLAERHHLVEVDPRPAFEELGRDPSGARLGALAAGAAGVLAGRLAARSRAWRGA